MIIERVAIMPKDAPTSPMSRRAPKPALAVPAATWWRRWEVPTWAVAVAIYAGYGLTTWYYAAMPWWLAMALGTWFVAWHGSLQHEALHGHPTRLRWLNTLIAGPPLWLWLPYPLYRESHLRHHSDDDLTLPGLDPESYYLGPADWARMGAARRAVYRFRNTFIGRLLIGPAMASGELLVAEARRLKAGDFSHVGIWIVHVGAVSLVLYWATVICGIPIAAYIALFAYPGLSLAMVRSYAEHRPAAEPAHRIAVVEAGRVMRLLFLNNNYHLPHHDRPGLAWYDLPAYYRANRGAFLERNAGYLFAGYGEQVRRFLLRPKDEPVHPLAAKTAAP